ncbi:glycosyltransferase [Rubrivirga marina]|uniref:Glycosyltransferase subfamily 4-like N-terminal domain-containing protein n=1 Tax=Rubrivirga marina TaxID=1196024 RepID=A0A271IW32_9BACT|nr:glycosyltransferase [Rubrivirga marina]PAP75327.1 hypothetical protein BSZ37_02140 [Rubrivirga marina]
MTRLLFIDPTTSHPYQPRTLYDRAAGATPTSVVRVAEGLAQRGHRVTVAQCHRSWPSRSPGGVAYVPFAFYGSWSHLPSADAVVVVEQHKVLPRVRRQFPEARLALWLRDVPGRRRRSLGSTAAEADATVVCVSDAHRAAVRDLLDGADGWARTARIHDPVDDTAEPDGTVPDRTKLVAVANLGGGLGEVLAAFAHVRTARPGVRLYVVGEGRMEGGLSPGVVPLGPLPHREVMRHVREAFAVFQPQAGAEVISGRLFAEANAVGTPVLAHAHAAVREALAESPGAQGQLVDARDPTAAARRLARWWEEGRPPVMCPLFLRTSRVVADWERLLEVEVPSRAVRVVPAPVARVPAAVAA